MSFMEAVVTCFTKYADFSGRARRSEYWYFTLFNFAVSFVLGLVLGEGSFITSIYSLATLVPGLAVSWRRLHDIGKPGGWYFIAFIPVVGWIPALIWYCRDSEPGMNAYGFSPKA